MDATDVQAAERERMKKEAERLYKAQSSVVNGLTYPVQQE
jgi:hypothetical protein